MEPEHQQPIYWYRLPAYSGASRAGLGKVCGHGMKHDVWYEIMNFASLPGDMVIFKKASF